MVQMKVYSEVYPLCLVHALYIPHGSDERKAKLRLGIAGPAFISHMVQMKAQKLVFIRELFHPLYPTWFR